jgi:hypothetical protein
MNLVQATAGCACAVSIAPKPANCELAKARLNQCQCGNGPCDYMYAKKGRNILKTKFSRAEQLTRRRPLVFLTRILTLSRMYNTGLPRHHPYQRCEHVYSHLDRAPHSVTAHMDADLHKPTVPDMVHATPRALLVANCSATASSSSHDSLSVSVSFAASLSACSTRATVSLLPHK